MSPKPIVVPEKPALEGLETKWQARWEAEGTYAFDRTRPRAEIYAIDTPPPTVSGSLHIGRHRALSTNARQGGVLSDGVGR